MSGRYLRAFLHEHRSTFDHTRNEDAVARSRRYEDVDYDQLLLHVKLYRDSGREGLRKVQSLADSAKRSKAARLLAQHREIWLATQRQLTQARRQVQRELDEWRCSLALSDNASSRSFTEELMDLEAVLLAESESFAQDAIKPVQTLRKELKKWLASSRLDRTVPGPNQAMIDELRAVQHQLDAMATALDHERQQCCSGLEHGDTKSCTPLFMDFDRGGLPLNVQELAWPNQESLEAVREEFLALDERYKKGLEELETKYAQVQSLTHSGWSEPDASRFAFVMEQYASLAPGQRALYIDRLMRELSHKSRDNIVAHEAWYCRQLLYYEQRKALLSSWSRHREELADRSRVVFAEVVRATQAACATAGERKVWAEYCQQLHKELAQWREHKLEMLNREMEVAACAQAEMAAMRKLEEERERAQREKQKKKLADYQYKKLAEHEQAQQQEQEIKEAACMQHTELALHNLDRVRHRKALHATKGIQLREAEEQAMRAKEEQERRLELLRQTVRIEAPSDPLRLLRETKVSLSRAICKEEVALQQPLFPVHGYTTEEVLADPRVKLEQALRQAGLHTSTYARHVMAATAPSHPPRRDQFSTVFKYS